MARQVINLGRKPFGAQNNIWWNGVVLLDAGLVKGGGTAYLRQLGWHGGYFTLRTATRKSSQDENPFNAGPELTDAFESAAAAITLSEAGGSALVIAGPAPGDSTEPYRWQPANGVAVAAWFSGLGNGVVTLTLDDGQTATPPPETTPPALAVEITKAAPKAARVGEAVSLVARTNRAGAALAWTADAAGAFSAAAAAATTWTPREAGAATLKVTASHGQGNSKVTATATVKVAVSAPTLTLEASKAALRVGETATLTAMAGNLAPGQVPAYAWSQSRPALGALATTAQQPHKATWEAAKAGQATLTVRMTVLGEVVTKSVVIAVAAAPPPEPRPEPEPEPKPDLAALAPGTAGVAERRLDALAAARLALLPADLPETCWDADRIPAEWLPVLAWGLSADFWNAEWTPAQQRAAILLIRGLHREKGTRAALDRVLDALGAVYTHTEPPAEDPFTARIVIRNTTALPVAGLAALQAELEAVKRASVHLTVEPAGQGFAGRIELAGGLDTGGVVAVLRLAE